MPSLMVLCFLIALSPYSTGNGVRVGYPTRMKSTPKKRNVHGQRKKFAFRTQRHLYSTDRRWGLVSGIMQILGLASGVMQILALGNAKIYQHVGISNAKFWRRGHCPTPISNARYFASQWNIGFKGIQQI